MGSSSATIPNLVGEVATFFMHFVQLEIDDLDTAVFWGSGPLYVDSHGFRVPQDYISHLEVVF